MTYLQSFFNNAILTENQDITSNIDKLNNRINNQKSLKMLIDYFRSPYLYNISNLKKIIYPIFKYQSAIQILISGNIGFVVDFAFQV